MGQRVGRLAVEKEQGQRPGNKGALPEDVRAGHAVAAGPTPGMGGDARLALPANAGVRVGLLTALQRRIGNGAVQRALAGTRARGRGPAPPSVARGPSDRAEQSGQAYDVLEATPLSEGMRFSFRMQAVLDNGEPSAEPSAGPPAEESLPAEGPEGAEAVAEGEEEEEEEEPIEGTIGPLTVQAVEDRHTLGVINLLESTVGGGVDLEGGMGRCEPQIDADFKVTPIGSKKNRNYWVVINATVEYHWAVSAAGRKHVSSADDPIVTMENWSQVFYDLMPIAGPFPRSPRRKYWNSNFSVAHELFHRDDFSKAFKRYKPQVEAWLPTQTAANIEAARGKCDEAMRKLIGKVEGYMGTGDFAPCESRAYKAGAPAYRALALAVRRRAKLYEWPEAPVERWEGEAGSPSAPGGAPAGTRDASPGGGRVLLQGAVQRSPDDGRPETIPAPELETRGPLWERARAMEPTLGERHPARLPPSPWRMRVIAAMAVRQRARRAAAYLQLLNEALAAEAENLPGLSLPVQMYRSDAACRHGHVYFDPALPGRPGMREVVRAFVRTRGRTGSRVFVVMGAGALHPEEGPVFTQRVLHHEYVHFQQNVGRELTERPSCRPTWRGRVLGGIPNREVVAVSTTLARFFPTWADAARPDVADYPHYLYEDLALLQAYFRCASADIRSDAIGRVVGAVAGRPARRNHLRRLIEYVRSRALPSLALAPSEDALVRLSWALGTPLPADVRLPPGPVVVQPLRRSDRIAAFLVVPIRERLPAGTVGRDVPETVPEGGGATATPTTARPTPTQAATTRAGTPSAAWPQPTAEERDTILGHIRRGNGPAALTALWSALSPGLSLAGRVTLERTDQPGMVEGQRIGRGAGATAMALAYVPQQPGCAGAPPDGHWQRHTADELRGLIQVNLGAIRGSPEQCLAQLHSTLMHEYTHVEQQLALGLYQGLTFLSVGDREFLSDEQVPAQQRELVAALDEIEAYSAEIEQAGRTGLATTPNIRVTVCGLWDAYRSYFTRSGQQPDPAVAARAYQNIERGRALYRRYLRSPQATPLPPRLLQFALTLYDCPRDYDLRTSILLPFVRSGAQPAAPSARPTAPATEPAAPSSGEGSTARVQPLARMPLGRPLPTGLAEFGHAKSGRPLPEGLRARFEPHFGLDFGPVRIHADERAAASAHALGARAYTLGKHIVFGAGEYRPETPTGAMLLAHELGHVAQGARTGRPTLQRWGVGEADPVAIERAISEVSHINTSRVRTLPREELDRLRALVNCTLETAFTASGSENYRLLVEQRTLIEGEMERRDVEEAHRQIVEEVRTLSTTWRTVLREELARQGVGDIEDWALEAIGSFVGLPYMSAHELYGGRDAWRAAYQRSGVYPPAVVCDQLGELTQRLARGMAEYGPPGLTGHYTFYQEHDPAFPSAPGNTSDPRCAPGATLFHTANASWNFREQASQLYAQIHNSGLPRPGGRAEVNAVRSRAGDLAGLLRVRRGRTRGRAALLAELDRLAGRPHWSAFAGALSALRAQVESASDEGVDPLLRAFADQVYEAGGQTLAQHYDPSTKLSHEFTLVAHVDTGTAGRLLFLDTWGPQGSGTMQVRPSTLGAERSSHWGFFQPPRPRRIPIYTPYSGVTLRLRGRVQEHAFDDIWQQSPVPPPIVFRYALRNVALAGLSAYVDFYMAGQRCESLLVGQLGVERGGEARFTRPQWMTERVEASRRGR